MISYLGMYKELFDISHGLYGDTRDRNPIRRVTDSHLSSDNVFLKRLRLPQVYIIVSKSAIHYPLPVQA